MPSSGPSRSESLPRPHPPTRSYHPRSIATPDAHSHTPRPPSFCSARTAADISRFPRLPRAAIWGTGATALLFGLRAIEKPVSLPSFLLNSHILDSWLLPPNTPPNPNPSLFLRRHFLSHCQTEVGFLPRANNNEGRKVLIAPTLQSRRCSARLRCMPWAPRGLSTSSWAWPRAGLPSRVSRI